MDYKQLARIKQEIDYLLALMEQGKYKYIVNDGEQFSKVENAPEDATTVVSINENPYAKNKPEYIVKMDSSLSTISSLVEASYNDIMGAPTDPEVVRLAPTLAKLLEVLPIPVCKASHTLRTPLKALITAVQGVKATPTHKPTKSASNRALDGKAEPFKIDPIDKALKNCFSGEFRQTHYDTFVERLKGQVRTRTDLIRIVLYIKDTKQTTETVKRYKARQWIEHFFKACRVSTPANLRPSHYPMSDHLNGVVKGLFSK